jgi:hypothetical protein
MRVTPLPPGRVECEIARRTRKCHHAEEEIRMGLEGFQWKASMAEICHTTPVMSLIDRGKKILATPLTKIFIISILAFAGGPALCLSYGEQQLAGGPGKDTVRIVGEKTFDVDIRGGKIYVNGKEWDVDERDEKLFTYAGLTGVSSICYDGEVAYLQVRHGIIEVNRDLEEYSFCFSEDGSNIIPDAMMMKDGSLLAVTPTSIMIITHRYSEMYTLQELFGDVPNFIRPTLRNGKERGQMEIRDPLMVEDDGTPLKILIWTIPGFTYQLVKDDQEPGK